MKLLNLSKHLNDGNVYESEAEAKLRFKYLLQQISKIYDELEESGGSEEQYALGDVMNLFTNLISQKQNMSNLDTMKIGYEQYLFSQLWAAKDDSFAELPYDEQWDLIPSKFREFEKSQFNIDTKPLYDCILAYFDAEELL